MKCSMRTKLISMLLTIGVVSDVPDPIKVHVELSEPAPSGAPAEEACLE